jgi:prepilin-type N-terminal cleavage/methylation domain-containing protein
MLTEIRMRFRRKNAKQADTLSASRDTQSAFTLIELLVVIAVISILAALLFPVFARAREKARQTTCSSNLRQIGLAMLQYEQDYDELMPSRMDLKSALPGGFYPWTGVAWPTSDPRTGWAAIVLDPYLHTYSVWSCPSVTATALGNALEVYQAVSSAPDAASTNYWMWPFEGTAPSCKDFWGKTPEKAVYDMLYSSPACNLIGRTVPTGVSDTQLAVDPYFPATTTTVPVQPATLAGLAAHIGGYNQLFLDAHVKWTRDARLGS